MDEEAGAPMMSTFQHQDGVTVGVDGSEPGYAAVRYAAGEAGRLGVPLDLVHAIPAYVPDAPGMTPMMPDPLFESYGAEVLVRARQVARESLPTVTAETHLVRGDPVKELVRRASSSGPIVLGSSGPQMRDRVWTGGTVIGVADLAPGPVIVVPLGYVPDDVQGRIVVGVQSPARAAELFDCAFPLAEAIDAELVVLHAWHLESGYDKVIAEGMVSQRRHERADLLEQELGDYRDAFPGVSVRVYIRHESPAHALVRVTTGADRLLLLRPSRGGSAARLGRISRAVLRDARCPVEVVPAANIAGPTSSRTPDRRAELV